MDEPVFLQVPRQLVIFKVGGTDYGVDIAVVAEILAPVPVTPIAKAPGGVLGLINVRKRVIPVFDLHWKFDVERDEAAPSRMIVVEHFEGPVALLVDSVQEVATLVREDYQPVHKLGDSSGTTYLLGCVRRGDRLVLWVDHNLLVPNGVAPAASEAA